MKRGQVFVRAMDETGRWGSFDVLDLDEESFRVFVLHVFRMQGQVVGLSDSACPGEEITLRVRTGVLRKD